MKSGFIGGKGIENGVEPISDSVFDNERSAYESRAPQAVNNEQVSGFGGDFSPVLQPDVAVNSA
jgi:hypothetical protein